jgi:hypothetical protein
MSDGDASEGIGRNIAAVPQQQGQQQRVGGVEDENMGVAGQQQGDAEAEPAAADMDGAAWVAAQRLHQQIALSLQ